MSDFKDPDSEFSSTLQNIFLVGVRLVQKLDYIAYLATNFGLCLANTNRRKLLGRDNLKMAGLRRESLWKLAIDQITDKPYIGCEFGVAWGYQTNYWLSRCGNEKIIEWHGFDTFTGLPNEWRHYKKGHFSNDGKPPSISDQRVFWYPGLIQNTLESALNDLNTDNNLFFSFDFDLFDPTYYALSRIIGHLKEGDMLYFDEPHDPDESSLVHMLIMLNRDKLHLVGYTPCQLLLRVESSGLVFPNYIGVVG